MVKTSTGTQTRSHIHTLQARLDIEAARLEMALRERDVALALAEEMRCEIARMEAMLEVEREKIRALAYVVALASDASRPTQGGRFRVIPHRFTQAMDEHLIALAAEEAEES